jgi:hypothetical protein
MQGAVDESLSEWCTEVGLRRLVWDYACPRKWSTIVFDARDEVVLATDGGKTWRAFQSHTMRSTGVTTVAWHEGQFYRSRKKKLWTTADPVDGSWTLLLNDTSNTHDDVSFLFSAASGLYAVRKDGFVDRAVLHLVGTVDTASWQPCGIVPCLRGRGGYSVQLYTATAVIGDALYVLGGMSGTWDQTVSRIQLDRFGAADTDGFVTHWDGVLCRRRVVCSAAVRAGIIYVGGGRIDDTVEGFDPKTQTSTLLPPMSRQRWGCSIAIGDGGDELYVIGGSSDARPAPYDTSSIEAFTFATNTWRLLPMDCPYIADCVTVNIPT